MEGGRPAPSPSPPVFPPSSEPDWGTLSFPAQTCSAVGFRLPAAADRGAAPWPSLERVRPGVSRSRRPAARQDRQAPPNATVSSAPRHSRSAPGSESARGPAPLARGRDGHHRTPPPTPPPRTVPTTAPRTLSPAAGGGSGGAGRLHRPHAMRLAPRSTDSNI